MTRQKPAFQLNQRSLWWNVFRAPLLLALVSALGLTSALLGDGVWDALSWVALAGPLGVIAWFAWLSRSAGSS